MAPAPMAWTSTRLWVRTTPAMAPATATGLEVAETLRISMAGRPERTVLGAAGATGVPWLPGDGDASVDPFDEGGVSRVCIYSNQYGIERDDAFGHLKPVGQARQEAPQADLTVHADHGVPRPHHSQVGDEGCAVGQNPGIRGRDVGMGPEYEAGPAVQAGQHLPLVPDVVARGQHVDSQAEEVVGDPGGQAEAAGRVLPVGHHQVQAILLAELRQEASDGVASRPADDVPDGEHGHDHWRMVAR